MWLNIFIAEEIRAERVATLCTSVAANASEDARWIGAVLAQHFPRGLMMYHARGKIFEVLHFLTQTALNAAVPTSPLLQFFWTPRIPDSRSWPQKRETAIACFLAISVATNRTSGASRIPARRIDASLAH